MSDLLRREAEGDNRKTEAPSESWSASDQLQVALEAHESLTNPTTVSLALGMSLSLIKMPAFIPAHWLAGTQFIVPTSGGIPLRSGRLKVMPVFTDAEAVQAWLPADRVAEHPCFGPPPDGVEVVPTTGLSDLREAAGAVMIFLNPAGPGGYQIDPEDGALDSVGDEMIGELTPSLGAQPERVGRTSEAVHPPAPSPAAMAPPPPAAVLVEPSGRRRMRERIVSALDQAATLCGSDRESEAVSLLAAADRLAELMGDYLHRAEMMMMAARVLETMGRRYAAGRLAHYGVLAASLSARGRLEMEAIQLRARLL